jgi:hypothetical protein
MQMHKLNVVALISGAALWIGSGCTGTIGDDPGSATQGAASQGGGRAGSAGQTAGAVRGGASGTGPSSGSGATAGSQAPSGSGGRAGSAGSGTSGTGGSAGARTGAGAAGSATGAGGAGGARITGGAGSVGSSAGASGSAGAGGGSSIGNPGGSCTVPAAAAAADVSKPTTVVGSGTAASCTAAAVVAAVAAGGVVTFNCGSSPLTIVVPEIEIINDGGLTKDGSVTIDGGGKITLSGGGKNRILRQNACDSTLHYTSSHCNDQTTPHLIVQNIGFTAGLGLAEEVDSSGLLGGGAIYVQGGTFQAVNITVSNSQQTNAANQLVQDLAGGAIYTVNMSSSSVVYVVNSTFQGNSGVNGGALGSIGTSWTVLNTVFKSNSATGHGENPAAAGTNGGGLGGAIYNDGNNFTLTICGSQFTSNQANELGSGSIFQVIDNLTGALDISQTTFTGNSDTGDVQTSDKHPGIFVEATSQSDQTAGVTITSSTFN